MKRKLLASIMAAVCALSAIPFSMNAAALTEGETAQLTVSNAKAGDKFVGYKVVNITYNSTSNSLTYEWNDDFSAYFIGNGGWSASLTEIQKNEIDDNSDDALSVEEFSALSQDNLQLVLANLANYASGKPTITTDAVEADTAGTADFSTQSMGGYFIVPSSTTEVYAPIFTKIEPTLNGNTYELKETEQSVSAKHEPVSVAKTVKNVTRSESTFADETTATVGDTLEYQIIANVPKYDDSALYKSFAISDILPTGLTFVDGSVTVQAMNETDDFPLTADTNYALVVGDDATTTGTTECFTVTVNKTQYDTIISGTNTWYNMSQIKITFQATLDTSAVIAATTGDVTAKNTNTVNFKFLDYPYVNTPSYISVSDTADVLTYGLQVIKYTGTGDNKTYLPHAEFHLYADSACTQMIKNIAVNVDGTLADDPDLVITDGDGKGYFGRLAPGTYYLKEVKAPAGYNILENAIPVTISVDTDDNANNIYKVATADDATTFAKNGYATIQVLNNAGFTLPSTGGVGTIVFCVLGILFMLIAVALIVVFFVTIVKKKSKANK